MRTYDEIQVIRNIHDEDDEFDDVIAPTNSRSSGTDAQKLDEIFEQGRFQLQQERNDFTLPQVIDFVESKTWINIRPEYQRRLRWDKNKKSRLIESILMNVPIPPIFLYEYDIGRYETMDGQQRLNSVIEYLNNEYSLAGLTVWSLLNGKRFRQLPPRIRRGLQRAKLSSIILVADTSTNTDLQLGDIRIQVFDRLNTGGEKLNAQELRNSLYSGTMNDLILELSSLHEFTSIWGIPPHGHGQVDREQNNPSLADNQLYKTMKDCEIVLRFFAFRDLSNIRGSVRQMLDSYMLSNRNPTPRTIISYRDAFIRSLDTNIRLFDRDVFRLPAGNDRGALLSRPLYDALMIACDDLASHREQLIVSRDRIKVAIRELIDDPAYYDYIVGKPNTARAIRHRIEIVTRALGSVVE